MNLEVSKISESKNGVGNKKKSIEKTSFGGYNLVNKKLR